MGTGDVGDFPFKSLAKNSRAQRTVGSSCSSKEALGYMARFLGRESRKDAQVRVE